MTPGDVISGKYRVLERIGSGGMGEVVSAEHLELSHKVAIKVIKSDADANRVKRFLREARAVVRVESEHICRVFDVGTHDDDRPFIVMELLEGNDLADHLENHGGLGVARAVAMTMQAGLAISAAHRAGVVHRDLKPSNLFVVRNSMGESVVKVLDFGISKVDDGDEALTETGDMLGSPRFMSPEQLKSTRSVDHRTDIWSMCAVLFELIGGTPAFGGGTRAELHVDIIQNPPDWTALSRHGASPALVEVLKRGLQKDPDDRFESMDALVEALTPFAVRMSAAPPPPSAASAEKAESAGAPPRQAPPLPTTESSTAGATVLPAERPRRGLWVAGVAAALAAAVAGTLGYRAMNAAPPSPASSATASSSVPATDYQVDLDAAKGLYAEGQLDEAKLRATAVVTGLRSEGVVPETPPARTAASAQLLLADIARDQLKWPEPKLDALGNLVEDVDVHDVWVMYATVALYRDVGIYQCAEVRGGATYLDYAKWMKRTALPVGASKADAERFRSEIADAVREEAMGSRKLLEIAAARPLKKGEGCHAEAKRHLETVNAFIDGLDNPP